ncbi:uncharacterized protein LOC124285614 [Haliotis rubra]|uniref:uncharacterized protein LOC124285614 n=1 Tax=Haliotis rubra TaxID=36100 RepID=UPI001EE5C4C9|nr:uncharacterized protein LOC124285614 [Haliotis rubra]
MSPEKRMIGEVYLLLVVSGMVQTQQCRNDSRIVAITTVRKLTSPHVFYNNQFDVSCWWRITASNRDGTICIIVQFPKMNSIRNCMMTYVDVHDGFDIDAKNTWEVV